MFHSAFEKDTWKGCLIRSERLDTNYCQVQGWKSFVYVSITKHPFEGHQILITKTIVLIWKLKAHFIQLHNLVHDFWKKKKKITRCQFLRRGAYMHQKSQRGMQKMWTSGFYLWTRVYTYRRKPEFQNILEKKLCNCFGHYWKMLNMDLNMILIGLRRH